MKDNQNFVTGGSDAENALQFYRSKNQSCYYRDLRTLRDDKTVLENPHKGWYYHFVDNGMHRPFYRDQVPQGYYFADVPGLRQLYLRLDWCDIEPQEGVYDWSYVDSVMEEWGKQGFTFSFRFCTFEPGLLKNPLATPKWVFDKGAQYYDIDGLYEPKYDCPVFLSLLERFVAECARKLDGNPLVEYVDVGCYGSWGEFHTFSGSGIIYPYEVAKYYVDMLCRHFVKSQLLISYGAMVILHGQDPEGAVRLADYVAAQGVGLRCDSVDVQHYYETFGYDTLESPDLFGLFNPIAPVDLEHAHQQLTSPEAIRDGLGFMEALKNAGASYAGFHGYVSQWYEKYPAVHSYIANRLGYWYFIDGFTLPDLIPGTRAVLSLDIRNGGWAKAYHNYEARVMLEAEDGTVYLVPCTGCDNTRWLPGENVTEHLKLDLSGVAKPGTYTLRFGLFWGERPIRLGLKQELYADGFYRLGKVTVQ